MVALNMGGFTKLFSRILISSVWSESNETRIVWITLLALTGPDGTARITLPGLSRLAVVPIGKVEEAIRILSSPDAYSRTAENEGRRIKEVRDEAGDLVGFFLFNYAKHRAIDATGAERQRKHRKKRDSNARQKAEGRRQRTEERTENERSFSPAPEDEPNGNGALTATERTEYANAVWTEFLRTSDKPVTRLMSPGEFNTVKGWMDGGIPLRIVLRAMADTKGQGRTLSYYAGPVQDAYEYHRQAVPL